MFQTLLSTILVNKKYITNPAYILFVNQIICELAIIFANEFGNNHWIFYKKARN